MTSLCANHSTGKRERGGGGSTLTGRGRRTVCTISQSGQRVRTAAAAEAAAYYVRRHVGLPLGLTLSLTESQSQFPVHALSTVHPRPRPTWPPRCTCVECVLARRIGSSFAYAAYKKCMKRVSEIDEIDIKCDRGKGAVLKTDSSAMLYIHMYVCSIFRLMAKPRWVHKYVRLRGRKWQELTVRRSLKCGLNMVWEEWKYMANLLFTRWKLKLD